VIKPKFNNRISTAGPSGNIFNVLANTQRLLTEHGVDREVIKDVIGRASEASSYTKALEIIREWFYVDTTDWAS
jgi:hypothetical protein